MRCSCDSVDVTRFGEPAELLHVRDPGCAVHGSWDPRAVNAEHPCVVCGRVSSHDHPAGAVEQAIVLDELRDEKTGLIRFAPTRGATECTECGAQLSGRSGLGPHFRSCSWSRAKQRDLR